MAYADIIYAIETPKLTALRDCIAQQFLDGVKAGGKRIVSVSSPDGNSYTFDLTGWDLQAAARAIRNELVKRGCARPRVTRTLVDMSRKSSCAEKIPCACEDETKTDCV